MDTRIISGSEIAKAVRADVRNEVKTYVQAGRRAPKLAVILVGNDPASEVYVRNKSKACEKVGILHDTINMSADSTEEEVIKVIEGLNADPQVDGILLQLPLPAHLDEKKITQLVLANKDVDGFHIENAGMLSTGRWEAFFPCTPWGVIEIMKREGLPIRGKHCVIVGRSNLVGKPEALLMLAEDATVTVCHSRTPDLKAFTSQADILVVAVGRPGTVNGDMIKEGAVVIDVGINRTEEGLKGDVDFDSCLGKAAAITPVPGGVGPMTIAMLLKNTLKAYKLHEQID
ncbi:MAG: bifunctional methylenetetrahydrofolate dehydrogenase/methenyltetrahydrofolate cyclohydrolase FolD [Lachnospiraceae bacterium]|nr:bifunctional methylenetetrahydrofolate dehydrogenase/methenyltetrahydrofolate cyclohydrolase FolD [Lachnospiraceae bacterium]